MVYTQLDFPGGVVVKICLPNRRCRFDPWVRKMPWRRKRQRISVFLPGKFHGQRSLVGYSPRGGKESDTTEQLSTNIHGWHTVYIYGRWWYWWQQGVYIYIVLHVAQISWYLTHLTLGIKCKYRQIQGYVWVGMPWIQALLLKSQN